MSTQPKRELFSHFAAIARALGHEHRLELLEHLGQGEQPVERLAERTGLAFANVSQHLQLLRRNGLVVSRRLGKQVLYRVAEGPVTEAIAALQRLAEKNHDEARAVIDGYFARLDDMAPVTNEELLVRLQDDTVTVIDVRPRSEFDAGHLPGARCVPLDEPEDLLSQLPPGREIVAYCRGRYCVLSFEAVHRLRGLGRHARRLADGLPEWRAAGLPVAV